MSRGGKIQTSFNERPMTVFVALALSPLKEVVLISAFTEEEVQDDMKTFRHLNWKYAAARTYQKDTRIVFQKLCSDLSYDSCEIQTIPNVDWGMLDDVEIVQVESHPKFTRYHCPELPFHVTLYSDKTVTRDGNSLEVALEFIPAIETFNISLALK